MPTYEYRCPECGTNFDKFQRMSDDAVADCPQCGAAAQRRLSGGAGLLFKGSGFYITDYRGEGYKKAAQSDSGGSDSGSSGGDKPASDSTSDSKPESKPESKPKTESKPSSGSSPKQAE
jgi:putative FmdB family regulatory protein